MSIVGGLFGGGGTPSANPDLANRLGSQIRLPGVTVKTPGLELGTFQTNARATRGLTTSNALARLRSTSRSGVSTLRNERDQFRTGLTGLIEQVSPGFGRLTEARVRGVQNARRQAIGNLRENLGQRRVSGSSFAQDALARAEREFGESEALARAQSFVEELDLSQKLLSERAARTQQLTSEIFRIESFPEIADIEQSNFEAQLAVSLAQGFGGLSVQNTRTIADLLKTNAALQAQSDQGFGELLGLAGGALLGPTFESAGAAINPFGLPTASTGRTDSAGRLLGGV